jgi:hypothetical protein
MFYGRQHNLLNRYGEVSVSQMIMDMIRLSFACLMVLNGTFNNISVISCRSILLGEETGGSRENHQPVASHWQLLSHNAVYLIPDRDSNSQNQW